MNNFHAPTHIANKVRNKGNYSSKLDRLGLARYWKMDKSCPRMSLCTPASLVDEVRPSLLEFDIRSKVNLPKPENMVCTLAEYIMDLD